MGDLDQPQVSRVRVTPDRQESLADQRVDDAPSQIGLPRPVLHLGARAEAAGASGADEPCDDQLYQRLRLGAEPRSLSDRRKAILGVLRDRTAEASEPVEVGMRELP